MNEIVDNSGRNVPALIAAPDAMTQVMRAEIDSQIATARAYPRDIRRAMANIHSLATMDEVTASECLYALVRRKKNRNRAGSQSDQSAEAENKPIEGPSIRLAEIAAQCWGNNRTVARVINVNRKEGYVEAVGIFHDLETNQASEATVRRNILTSGGHLFSNDMITVTGNAACSIARRNAILAGIPRGVYRGAYDAAREMTAGTVVTLSVNRDKAIQAFSAYGVTPQQLLEVLDLESDADIRPNHIAILRAMFTAIRNGEATVEEMFAAPEPTKPKVDPSYNPLVRTNDPISTGAPARGGDATRDASVATGSTEAQGGVGAGDAPAAESSTGNTGQRELLSDEHVPEDSKGEPTSPGQPEGAGGVGDASPPAPDRLRAYSSALIRVTSGPPTLGKQSDAWLKENGSFTGADEAKRSAVYATHLKRITQSVDLESCKAQVEAIIEG